MPEPEVASRHSPAPPLAPLEYLQNQRRGSITDPSLHAAAQPSPHISTTGSNASSSISDSQTRNKPSPTARSASPFVSGDSSVQQSADPPNPHIRHLFRPSSAEHGSGNGLDSSIELQKAYDASETISEVNGSEGSTKRGSNDAMDTDPPNTQGSENNSRRQLSAAREFVKSPRPEDAMLNQQPRGSTMTPGAGTKRKISSDRILQSKDEDIDPQLSGAGGFSTSMVIDQEGPASKRRSSAFDTQKIAQLSLNDRRNSVDSRMSINTAAVTNSSGSSTHPTNLTAAPNPSTWWVGDRRDSTSSMLSSSTSINSSVGYNSPAFTGDLRSAGGGNGGSNNIATFAWPPTAGPSDPTIAPSAQGHEFDPHFQRPFDPSAMPPHSVLSGAPFDRRMSVPEVSSTSTRPERVLRSRSRPPSRAAKSSRTNEAQNSNQPVTPSTVTSNKQQEDPSSATSSSGSNMLTPQNTTNENAAPSTPYSRSPELRVSHKLAERKRRKEMKDLFDELRDQLPADRGMKASKWEILSKAIDFIQGMKQTHQEMVHQIDILRHELEIARHGVPMGHPGAPPHTIVYGQVPPPQMPSGYPPPVLPPQPPPPQSRPGSSPTFSPTTGQPPTNGKNQVPM